jgi:hypothetical protein
VKRPVTLRRIEIEGRRANRRALWDRDRSYLEKYGIKNIWQHWIMRQDSRLNALPQDEICGWVEDDA